MQRSESGRSSGPSDGTARARARGGGGAAGLRFGGQRRELAIRRIDDERRAVVPFAIGHPELVVVAGRRVVRRLLELALVFRVQRDLNQVAEDRVATLIDGLGEKALELVDFGVGDRRLVLPLRRAGHRGHAVVAPHALQVGLAVRGARHLPAGRRIGRILAALTARRVWRRRPRSRRTRTRREPGAGFSCGVVSLNRCPASSGLHALRQSGVNRARIKA